ncbi:hypothetical protein SK3146_03988 [Paenibacillus konkukensis]|uniref:Uncharacterized protein n=1 Tax=Paenibacillus konkukensis TaxID=2020716 RepID=A0ABY4RT74_9BACL|nr:hypothetical protein [Paenibacillus konkukensis]UQZ84733.1 hypothetical protein SK3146_03988 [Paenibacillus konkukensis]
MAIIPLKDSPRKDQLQALHAELWDKLQEQDEELAVRMLEDGLKSLEREPAAKLEVVKNFLRTKGFWISVTLGVLTVPLLFILFVWAALWVE